MKRIDKALFGFRAAAMTAFLCLAATGLGAAGTPTAQSLPGDSGFADFPDSASLRAPLYGSVIAGPRDEVLGRKPAVYTNEYGSWRLSTEKTADAFYLVLSPKRGADYPAFAQGSWIIKRSLADGRFLQAKVFLRSDSGCFIRLYPNGERSLMDIVLYGAVLNRGIPLPVDFDTLVVTPMKTMVAWTEASFDWSLFSPHPGDYSELRAFSKAVRSRLPSLRYADDGGLDGQGRPIFIATGAPQKSSPGLNCSGFAQWVIDGLLSPLGEAPVDPRDMAERHPELRKAGVDPAIEARTDPFFGLDWTRNLGRAWADAYETSHRHSADENDVRISAFALYSSSKDPWNGGPPYDDYPAYDPDSGYQIRGLKALLYVLAMRDPGMAYLASFSRADRTGLRRHYHVAILLPWFDEGGEFRVDVYESDAETSLEAILKRAPLDYVHLVRIAPSRDFDPPALP
jgi:hypothetical protein